MELAAFQRLGGTIRYGIAVTALEHAGGRVTGVTLFSGEVLSADAIVLACGGFEASADLREDWMGGR